MNEAQRILGKVVGHEISAEELKMIVGGVACGKDKVTTGHSNGPDTCDTPIKE